MISMCGNCSAKVVSVMDGHRPQIRCEGRWRAPYMAARYGSAWGNTWNLVFTNEVGGPLDRHNVLRRDLKPMLEGAGLPPLTFHDLRSVAGSLALDHGVPLPVVSHALGHSDISTTARHYAHMIKGAERKVAAAFDEMAVGL